MNKQTDILVIGGGAIGVCCAHYLTQSGRQVSVIEKGDIGCGAYLGNAVLVIPGQSIPLAAPGVITKGLKWMLDPEGPFYIKPRFELNCLSFSITTYQEPDSGLQIKRSRPFQIRVNENISSQFWVLRHSK